MRTSYVIIFIGILFFSCNERTILVTKIIPLKDGIGITKVKMPSIAVRNRGSFFYNIKSVNGQYTANGKIVDNRKLGKWEYKLPNTKDILKINWVNFSSENTIMNMSFPESWKRFDNKQRLAEFSLFKDTIIPNNYFVGLLNKSRRVSLESYVKKYIELSTLKSDSVLSVSEYSIVTKEKIMGELVFLTVFRDSKITRILGYISKVEDGIVDFTLCSQSSNVEMEFLIFFETLGDIVYKNLNIFPTYAEFEMVQNM